MNTVEVLLGTNADGDTFYRLTERGQDDVLVTRHAKPGLFFWYSTWAAWECLGYKLSGFVTPDGALCQPTLLGE